MRLFRYLTSWRLYILLDQVFFLRKGLNEDYVPRNCSYKVGHKRATASPGAAAQHSPRPSVKAQSLPSVHSQTLGSSGLPAHPPPKQNIY